MYFVLEPEKVKKVETIRFSSDSSMDISFFRKYFNLFKRTTFGFTITIKEERLRGFRLHVPITDVFSNCKQKNSENWRDCTTNHNFQQKSRKRLKSKR